jgi:hypothetical protein
VYIFFVYDGVMGTFCFGLGELNERAGIPFWPGGMDPPEVPGSAHALRIDAYFSE